MVIGERFKNFMNSKENVGQGGGPFYLTRTDPNSFSNIG